MTLNHKRTISTILFLFIATTCSSQIYDQELEQHKLNTKAEFSRVITAVAQQISDPTLSLQQKYDLFDPIIDYANNTHSNILQIRKKYLQKTPSPPHALNQLSFQSTGDSDMAKMLEDRNFTTLTLLQCYKPIEIANLINGMIQPAIYQSTNSGINAASTAYIFGNQVFAKHLQENQWQIWLVNRAYVLRFNLDIVQMTINNLTYTIPNTPAYLQVHLPFIAYQQQYEIDGLYQQMNELRWKTYSVNLLKESQAPIWKDSVNQRLHLFYTQNKPRFFKVQNQMLHDLQKADSLAEGWEEFKGLFTDEKQQLDQTLHPYILQVDEAAHQLFSFSNSLAEFNQNIDEVGRNAMTGFRNYSLGNEKNGIWKIQSKGYSIAFEYNWNTNTGAFSEIKIFKRKS